ncbi:spore germination protein A3 precursor [Peptococcaceae bacterium CEB3]|nr:spore germination protein A3 precursor [Peptococcaceae bacterium CEB3]
MKKLGLRRKGKRVVIFLSMVSLILVGGCWDSRSIEQLAVVKLIGFDKISDNGISKWQVSAVILQPHLSTSGPGGNGSNQAASPEIVWKGTGISIRDAVNDFGKRIPKTLFFGQEKAVVIGKRAAATSLKEILEIRERFDNARPRSLVLITNGEAYNILKAEAEAAQSLSVEIGETAMNTIEPLGNAEEVSITQLLGWLLSSDRDAVLPEIETYQPVEKRPGIRSSPAQSILIQHMAVFRAGNLAGWLDKGETTGYLLATHKVRNAQIVVPFDDQGSQRFFVINKSDPCVTPNYLGDRLRYDLEIKVGGQIYDSGGLSLTSSKIKELEPKISSAIAMLVKKTIDKSQALGADFLGFSEALHRKDPVAWEEIKPNWRERYRQAEIDVTVRSKIMNIGRGASEIAPEP